MSTLALAMLGVQPMFAGALADKFGLDVQALGVLIGTEQGGGVLGTFLAFWIIGRFDLRVIGAVASAVAVITSFVTPATHTIEILLAWRFLFGASSMIAYTTGIVVLARSINPDRSFGIMLFLQTIFFAGYAAVFPRILTGFGFLQGMSSFAFWFVCTMVAAALLPASRQPQGHANQNKSSATHGSKGAMFVLVAVSLLQAAILAEWGFLDRVGQSANIAADQVGYAFSIGLLGGIPGGILPAILGTRLKHWQGIGIGAIFILLANCMFAFMPGPMSHFTIAVFLLNLGWCFSGAYYLGFIAQLDDDGRATRLIPFGMAIGNMVGPLGVASITVGERFWGIFSLSAVCVCCGFAITCWVSSRESSNAKKGALISS
jgi:predicted MFS family arabinose efflux permease